jgi:outer membrane immunogenic protein
MKNIVFAVAMSALATGAMAADLPSRAAPPVFVPPPPVFSWTGFYLGINAGYAFDGDQSTGISANDAGSAVGLTDGAVSPFVQNRSDGFTGGGQIGYNYQFPNSGYFGGSGGVVVGLEADASYTDLNQTSDTLGLGGFDTQIHSRTDFVGTVRGRLGYAFDRFLVYGTGGFAYGDVHSSTNLIGAGSPFYSGAQNSLRTGYAYGGGIEYALPTTSFLNVFHSSAVTVKAEFLRYDLGSTSYLVPAPFPGSSFTSRVHTDGNIVRAGLNFKFDSYAPAPIVAKY